MGVGRNDGLIRSNAGNELQKIGRRRRIALAFNDLDLGCTAPDDEHIVIGQLKRPVVTAAAAIQDAGAVWGVDDIVDGRPVNHDATVGFNGKAQTVGD